MSSGPIKSVVILGAGPASSMLSVLLVRGGIRTTILYRPRQIPLLVGESLVPAIIPMLRLLGVEETVRSFSTFKPGACFNISPEVDFAFPFDQVGGPLPPYAYNVPRDRFDDTLLEAARNAGVGVVEVAAGLERVEGTDRVRLDQATRDATRDMVPREPDLIVDATGRARLLPNLLQIPSQRGQRQDTALFAHLDRTKIDHEGFVHTTRLDHGWSWRIPLPGRVSVGMVINSEYLPKFGQTKEERYDNLLRQDSVLRNVAEGSKRLTPVMEHTNYQLVSQRVTGDGWALVGDTAGFIDPVFSSGLFIAMEGATALARAIQVGTTDAFARYQRDVIHHLETWHEIVDHFYSGRLFTCFAVGQRLRSRILGRMVFAHVSNQLGRIFTGAASTSPYSLGVLRLAMKYGLNQEDRHENRIR
jgi:flavin-dependent dehydrogenase